MMGAIRQLPQHHPEQVEAEDDVRNEFDVDMRRDLASGHGSPEHVEAEGLKVKDRGRGRRMTGKKTTPAIGRPERVSLLACLPYTALAERTTSLEVHRPAGSGDPAPKADSRCSVRLDSSAICGGWRHCGQGKFPA